MVRKATAAVPIVIKRLDTLPGSVSVTLRVQDQSATFGRDHFGLTGGAAGSAGDKGSKSVTMTIDSGTSEVSAMLHTSDKNKYFQCLTRLELILTASADAGESKAPLVVGPVTLTRVAILDVSPFPNNHDFQYLDLVDHGTSKFHSAEDGKGDILSGLASDSGDAPRPSSLDPPGHTPHNHVSSRGPILTAPRRSLIPAPTQAR